MKHYPHREEEVVVLRVFNTHIEADLARSALEATGIEALLAADDAGELQPHLDWSRGVALMVRAEDAIRAAEILDSPARNV